MKYWVCTLCDNSDNDWVLVRFMYNYALENMTSEDTLTKDEHLKYFKSKIPEECKQLIEDGTYKYFTEQLDFAIKHGTIKARFASIEYREINKFFNPAFNKSPTYTGVHLYLIEPPENHSGTYSRDVSGPRDIPEDE